MASAIGKSVGLSCAVAEEREGNSMKKQGIVSILAPDCNQMKAASLRRTLSADMSSKKWLSQSGFYFSPLKKTASSQQLAADSSSSSVGEEDYDTMKNPKQLYIWSTILNDKAMDDSSKLSPPYIHPLVKRSSSPLSKKSLQICTESLGSETGSEFGEQLVEEETEVKPENNGKESFHVEDFPAALKPCFSGSRKKSPALAPASFPPPLSSLAPRDGQTFQMHSRRVNGRLVMEAMAISSHKYFCSQRQDGRLVLTFANSEEEEGTTYKVDDDVAELEEEQVSDEHEEEEAVEKEYTEMVGILKDQRTLPIRAINIGRSPMMMKKLMEEEEEVEATVPPESVPRPPPATAAGFINAYDYLRWSSVAKDSISPMKADCLFPLFRGCKEPRNRRPLFIWETYCVATS